jgi:hypothetical protein
MSLVDINAALVVAYQGASLGLPTAWEGVDFTPPTDAPWAQFYMLPAPVSVDTLGANGLDLHTGVLQIDLNVPQNTGTGALLGYADTLRGVFKAGTSTAHNGQSVLILDCSRSRLTQAAGWLIVSMSITWRAYTAR